MQGQAERLKEEEAELARKNVKSQFAERLLNPTAGSRNLLRCVEAKSLVPPSATSMAASISPSVKQPVKSITAKELLQQHKQQMEMMKASQQKTPQLGRGLEDHQEEIDLSEEVSFVSLRVDSKLFGVEE